MSFHPISPEHRALYDDLVALLNKHASEVSAMEMLAIASNMVGKIVAMQDRRKVTPAQAMEVVWRNIEAGNAEMLRHLSNGVGGVQ